eukprot:1159001-Pelagomonas_calceolata.AAC.16
MIFFGGGGKGWMVKNVNLEDLGSVASRKARRPWRDIDSWSHAFKGQLKCSALIPVATATAKAAAAESRRIASQDGTARNLNIIW